MPRDQRRWRPAVDSHRIGLGASFEVLVVTHDTASENATLDTLDFYANLVLAAILQCFYCICHELVLVQRVLITVESGASYARYYALSSSGSAQPSWARHKMTWHPCNYAECFFSLAAECTGA